MKKQTPQINFNAKRPYGKFDMITLEEIFEEKPQDHSQFEHHRISFYVIVIILDKTGKHSIDNIDYSYKKGTVFTLRKNCIHKFYKSNAKGKFLVFTEDFVIRYSDKNDILKLFQLFNEMFGSPKLQLNNSDFTEIHTIIKQIENEFLAINDKQSIEVIKSLLHILIIKLFRIKSIGNDNFENKKYYLKFITLQELIEKECFESKKVSYYANKMGITTRTLNNITQSVIGINAKSFIDVILIHQIKRLVFNSQLSFKEIAHQAGFDEPTNFFKYFKKKTGISPKQFKENFK